MKNKDDRDTSWLFAGYETKKSNPEQFKGNEEFKRQQEYLKKFLNKMMEGKEDEKTTKTNT